MSLSFLSARLIARALLAPALLAAGLVLSAPIALAQPPAPEAPLPAAAPPPSPAASPIAPGIRDEAGLWSEADRARMNQAVQDLFSRDGCLVVIETYQTLPGAENANVNLSDAAAVDRALNARRDELARLAGLQRPRLAVVMMVSSGGNRSAYSLWSNTLGNEERGALLKGIMDRTSGRFGPGMPGALAYLGGFLEGRETVQQPAPQKPAADFGIEETPGVHDEVGFWSQNGRARAEQLIQDLYQRFHVRVFVDGRLKMPPEWTRGVNFNDPGEKTRAFNGWLHQRTNELADGHPGITILILACQEVNGFLTNVAWRTPRALLDHAGARSGRKSEQRNHTATPGQGCPGVVRCADVCPGDPAGQRGAGDRPADASRGQPGAGALTAATCGFLEEGYRGIQKECRACVV
jgi:hypothetical protein